ncbi:family 20 glycosylhydrolase [uncultured Lacinutrix sp.]|uniref:beta-N-acetylhexosaminidase n=1 Tax=uncultured Lacinutrix sp. TaxID=574032 RepID=UPI002622EC46|nr:family 20 glycosylhydrolase [uncultured Lacinutrix sp.]
MKKHIFLLILLGGIQFTLSQNELSKRYNLMPWPHKIQESHSNFLINNDITLSINANDEGRVYSAGVRFLRRLSNRSGIFIDRGFPLKNTSASIEINFDTLSNLDLSDDESYNLNITKDKVLINTITDVGALRALETLLQLVNFNETGYYFEGVIINDTPRFIWRGLMIDTARHFQPIDVIKRNLDAMASVKLNVFHWHLTDDQGFRVESKIYPKLQELASDGLYYSQEQIKGIVAYASNLGIRVIPEFDVPGHASAILTAYPNLGSKDNYNYTIERYAGVFDPTMDPTNEETYVFLDHLFTEMAALFPDKYFHIGGDENEGKHWTENKKIERFKEKHKLKDNHELQTYFNIRLEKILNKLGKHLMGWDEIMTPNMPTTAVIHSWRGKNEGLKSSTLIEAAKKGYQTVLSNGYYIDRMLSVKHHYSVDPIGDAKLTQEEQKRILGAEATMWSELVTPETIDSRIWPRTAAIAERFWSAKEINDIDNMLHRLQSVNNRLEELGITHIKNRAVILRNIANYQDISALQTLADLCEPLKVYSRNAGGTEYKTFSPFTLFADACTADAIKAVSFNNLVKSYNKTYDKVFLNLIIQDLETWSKHYNCFLKISNNPNVKPLELLSENLSKISKLLSSALDKKTINKKELNELNTCISVLRTPFLDTELAIVDSLETLIKYCEANYLIQ